MRKPNLIIPGFPKSGTSALHDALIQNSEISDGGRKEPHTYSWDSRYKNRHHRFQNLYGDSKTKYILDSSTTYLVSKHAVKRIVNDSPHAKFIVIARDPIDRIVSHYNWLSSKNLVNRKPKNEIRFFINKKFNYRNHYKGNYKAYIDFSLYGGQMKRLLGVVNSKNVMFFKYEDFFSNFKTNRRLLESFLDCDLSSIVVRNVNKTTFKDYKKSPPPSIFKRLKNRVFYEYEIIKGFPRTLKVRNPERYSTTRKEIEEIVFPQLRHDLRLLESLGYNLTGWPTYEKL